MSEVLQDKGINQASFAASMGITSEDAALLLAGRMDITPELAQKLVEVIGGTVETWLNIQIATSQKNSNGYSFSEMISQVTPENSHAPIDTGPAVGNEKL